MHAHTFTYMHACTHTHTLSYCFTQCQPSVFSHADRVYHPHGSFLLLVVGWHLLTVWPLHASGHWCATQVVKHMSDPLNQHNKGFHQDQIHDDPSALSLALWAKDRIWLQGGTDAPNRLFMKEIGLSCLSTPPVPLSPHKSLKTSVDYSFFTDFQSLENSRSFVPNAQRPPKILKTLKNEWRLTDNNLNNNEYFEHLTCTGPKHSHIL